MKIKSLLKHNLMRAAMTLALILACATAWAQTKQSVTYIDAYGQQQTASATLIEGGWDELELTAGYWYVVSSDDVYRAAPISVNGDGAANIILADGAWFTYDGANATIVGSLNIYGQSEGTGKFDFDNSFWTGTEPSNLIIGNLTIYGGHVILIGHDGEDGSNTQTAVSGNVTIYRGSLYAKGGSHSWWGSDAITGNVSFYGGNLEARGGSGSEMNGYGIYKNIYLSWSDTLDRFFCDRHNDYSSITIEANKFFVDEENTIHSSANVGSLDGHILYPLTGWHQNGNVYTISDANGWNAFCEALQDNETYNRFSGDTVKLGADITVTRMAGSSYHDFCGTFDGQGHTLTVDYGSAESPITADNAAPFVNVESGCIIENLHVAGDIYTKRMNAAGIAGTQYGAVTIRNCRVSTAIHSYTSGDGTHGGLVGNNGNGNGSALSIEGCVFDGKLLTEGDTATIKCGGFVGWCHKEVTISNSLFAPTEVTIGTTSSATFARNGATITNCYYTTDFNDGEHFTAQGKQARSITAGNYVTVENAGTATTYSTSGITSYGTGILYDNVLYAGNGDEVNLTLNNSIGGDVPEGYQYAYSTNAGTLEGSTLTMPDANVIVSVSTALRSTGQPVSITYNYYGGYNLTHDAIALDGTESSLGESGQEWYFVGTDISHSGTITCSGNVNIILADGKTMTITSSDGYGIDVNNFFLTIYGQELGTGTLNAIINNGIGIYSNTGNITIRGGQVTATMSGSFGDGIYTQCGSVTIYGGQVTATGNTTPGNSGISAFTGSVTINGGQVTTTGSSGIYTDSGSVTINGGQVTANGNNSGIQANGSVTINGGQVTATGGVGIYTQSGSVTINGGQVSAIGNYYGICAEDSNNITLGWTTASDYIYANTYYADYDYAEGTLSIAEGKAFIDEDGNIYSGTIAQVDQAYALDGKWLYPNTVSRFTKTIAAHHTEEGVNYGWYLIASPLTGGTNAEAVAHLVNSETPANFDLYRFNQSADLEWENWKQQNSHHYHFNLEPGRGYLYANAADVNLVFAGTPYSGNGEVTITNVAGHPLSGWNLVGNPFAVSATLTQPYYRMNAEGSALKTETETTAVAAMEGVFVQANQDSQTVTFTAQTRGGEQAAIAQANIMVGGDNGAVIDNAIIRFDGGQTLEKFCLRQGSTKLYIPQGGKDYAIACSNGQGEMPLNFRAKENGEYTITVNVDHVEMSYLHLIDNLTGADVDLLAANGGDARHGDADAMKCKFDGVNRVSTYTFTAKTTDYESRFKLVFSTNDADDTSTGSETEDLRPDDVRTQKIVVE